MDVIAFEETISDEYDIVHDRVGDAAVRTVLLQRRDEHMTLFRKVKELEIRRSRVPAEEK